jgi:integrase
MRAELRSLRALSPDERRVLVRSWTYLLAAHLALRFLPVARVEALLSRLPGRRAPDLPRDRVAQLLAAAARHHLRPMTCLTRSLALRELLRRQDVPTELRIGVRREDGELRAHAWVEHDGTPVGDSDGAASRYLPLSDPPR